MIYNQLLFPMEANSVLKLMMIGSNNSGKTSIVSRFTGADFEAQQNPTIGLNFTAVTRNFGALCVKLDIWDASGGIAFQ